MRRGGCSKPPGRVHWDVQDAGADSGSQRRQPAARSRDRVDPPNGTAIKGPITTPVGTGFRSVNVGLRKALDLYAQVRPCKHYPGVRTRYAEGVDLVIVRENTEDLYAGIEFEAGTDGEREVADDDRARCPARGSARSRASRSSRSPSRGSARIVQFAFDYARAERPPQGHVVHKANIMKHTDGLWLACARRSRRRTPDIEFEDRIVDNMCMQLVQKPELYDVLVLPEPVRRHRLRPGRRPGRRARRRSRRQLRRRTGRCSSRRTARRQVRRARTRSTRSR